MEIEKVTQEQINAIQRAAGMGAMIVDFHNVDLDAGRGVLDGNNRCVWTKDGKRITVAIPQTGGFIVSQGKNPDPEYPNKKEGNNAK